MPGKIDPGVLLDVIERRSRQATDQGLPFWGVVAQVDGARVAVRPLASESNAYELIARAQGIVNVGDNGVCIPVSGGGLVFMRTQGSVSAGTDLITPITFESLSAASVPNTSTPVAIISGNTPTLPAGSYGAVLRASAVMWRSVATGGCWLQLALDDVTAVAHLLSTDGLNMTIPLTYQTSVVVTPGDPIVLAASDEIGLSLQYRGSTVAGTTNILNARVDGFVYRIS